MSKIEEKLQEQHQAKAEEFVRIWEVFRSGPAVAERLGVTVQSVHSRLAKYRSQGVTLSMPRESRTRGKASGQALDTERLNEVAAEVRASLEKLASG